MDELNFIRALRPYLAPTSSDLVIAGGDDDAACWRETSGGYTVASCDTFVEKVHFDLEQQDPEAVGWRALAFALGDLAAKGATPTYGLCCLSLTRRWKPATALAVYRGMAALANSVGLRLVGGDTSLAPHDASISLTVLGRCEVRPLARSEVRPGWAIAVTGPLGGAGLNWERPRPRLAEGRRLNAIGLCCGDISDGLLRELDKFHAISGLGARLQLARVPLVQGARPLAAIASGEEVELVCAGPPELMGGLHLVGEFTEAGEVTVVGPTGEAIAVEERGYDHFA